MDMITRMPLSWGSSMSQCLQEVEKNKEYESKKKKRAKQVDDIVQYKNI